jgi:hypothetical protein
MVQGEFLKERSKRKSMKRRMDDKWCGKATLVRSTVDAPMATAIGLPVAGL